MCSSPIIPNLNVSLFLSFNISLMCFTLESLSINPFLSSSGLINIKFISICNPLLIILYILYLCYNEKSSDLGENMAISLTKQEFIDKVFDYKNNKEWDFKGKKPAIIDFYADWCGPCKMLAPIYDELSKEYGDRIDFYKINTDKEQEISMALGVQSLPTIIFVPVGEKPKVSVGFIQKDSFEDAIKDLFKV
ncbi:Thioredoxin [Borrelia parkeri SLO]|uniref:Thioredoxin n=2 Tax=Borrelia parkeri TaxID=141 RepID=A0ABM5PL09_BORPR|nr:Thioredoxin [Borrelia parkeri SLO]